MMDGFVMRGLDTVLYLLERLQEDTLTAQAQEGMRDGLNAVCEEAKALCPRNTGDLQASIHVRLTQRGGEVMADAPHAIPVELGTAYSPARPFLFPAMRSRQREVVDGVHSAISRHLKRG